VKNGARGWRWPAFPLVAGALLFLVPAVAAAQGAQPVSPPPQNAERTHSDGRRTIALLPANLARGVVGVFTMENLRPALVGTAATGISSFFDDRVRRAISNSDSTFGRAGAVSGGGVVMGSIVAGFFVASRFSDRQRFRAATYDLLTGMFTTEGYTVLLKAAVNRTRPSGPSSRFSSSFPSGHTSTTFALASVLGRHAGWKAGLPAYAFASFVGASRVRFNRHYLSDVVAGAALGIIVGRTSVRVNGRTVPASRQTRRPTVSVSLLGSPGLGVAIGF
jgi:membrane-associated phospholipid phosphatase